MTTKNIVRDSEFLTKKTWTTPTIESFAVAEITENTAGPNDDGLGVTTDS